MARPYRPHRSTTQASTVPIPARPTRRPATVLCALNECGDEAVYINEQLVRHGTTIYMGELVQAIEARLPAGQPIRISQLVVTNETWPESGEDLEPDP